MEELEPQQKKRIQREQVIMEMRKNSFEIQQINHDIFQDIDFQILLFFCNQHKNYKFDYMEQLVQHPILLQFQYFQNVHNQRRGKKITYDQKIADKLKLLLSQNRVTPKILAFIKVKGNEIMLKSWSNSFEEEIMKALNCDDYLIHRNNNSESVLTEPELIAKLLELLLPYKERYINNHYLSNSDISQIKETHSLMAKIDCHDNKHYQSILQSYDQIMDFLNQSPIEFDNDAQLNRAGPLKTVIYRKIGKIYILELVKQGIGLPRILQQITLLEASQQNCFGQQGTINLRFSQCFHDYLSGLQELSQVTEKLELKKLGKLISWKGFKNYYFSVIVQQFQEFERYSEDDCLQLQLEFLLQTSDCYKDELKKQFKNSSIAIVVTQVEQRINYFLDKESSNDISSSVFQIGLQLVNLRNKILDKEKDSQPRGRYKYIRKPPVLKDELENPKQEYRSITVMLTSQRMKFSFLIKFFVSNLVKHKQPYPFIISIVKCHRFLIRVLINYSVLDYLVREDRFIKFMQEEYQVDLSEGTTQERIKKIIQINYSDMIKYDLVNLSWTTLLSTQADLIFENRERLSWELEKYVKCSRFDKEVDKIQDSGDTCPKRIELSKKIKKIRDYLFQRESN